MADFHSFESPSLFTRDSVTKRCSLSYSAPSRSSLALSDSSSSSSSFDIEEPCKIHRRLSHRSWSQQARLWLLQSKQCILLWKRLLVIVGTLTLSTYTVFHQNIDLTENPLYVQRILKQSPHDRILFQDLPYSLQAPSLPSRSSLVLEQAGYGAKPFMMGMLWPTHQPGNDDYYEDRHKEIIDDGLELQKSLVVSLNHKDFSILTKDRLQDFRSKVGRRSLNGPDFSNIFVPSDNRQVTFDINYTQPVEPSLEEEDEGMEWPVPEGCKMQYEWQTEFNPTCNKLHEQDVAHELLESFSSADRLPHEEHSHHHHHHHDSIRARLMATGGYRNVWMIHNGTEIGESFEGPVALKTLLYERDWYPVQYSRHNLDAVVTSRLQQSSAILNIYGHCGTSGLYEFAQGGDLHSYTKHNHQKWNSKAKLKLCYNVAKAIADLHNMAKEGEAVVAHTDIFPNQFLRVDPHGAFKLNDFNRARWIHLPDGTNASVTTKESCGFTFPKNRGPFRSPEEYAYRLETEAVDIFSMGNVFYTLLVGEMPFANDSRDTVKRVLVKEGRRYHIPTVYKESTNPLIQGIVKAIRMSWIQEPSDRATAREVEQYLRRVMIENGLVEKGAIATS